MTTEEIPHVNIRSDIAERYYARLIQGVTDREARTFIRQWGGEISMPCGAIVSAEEVADKPCPNSGNCAAGHKECWVVKVRA